MGIVAEPVTEKKAWAPPAWLSMLALVVGLILTFANLFDKIIAWLRPPPMPAISQEYLMIDVNGETPSARDALVETDRQVDNARFVVPSWIDGASSEQFKAEQIFCESNEVTMVEAFDAADDPKRTALIQSCMDHVQTRTLVATYSLRSLGPAPSGDIEVRLTRFTNSTGWVDALDGFVDAEIKDECLYGNISQECIGTADGDEVIADLPMLGVGESLVIPIFLAFMFNWSEANEQLAYDGIALTPIRFPSEVRIGGRILFAPARPMRETPTLAPGFYTGRG